MITGTGRADPSELAFFKPPPSPAVPGRQNSRGEAASKAPEFKAFGADGFTFLDFIDIINPLQHIPVIATLYREMTGDSIDPGSRIAGGALFGGIIGVVAATVNVALKEATGKDLGDQVVALLEGGGGRQKAVPATAQATIVRKPGGLSPVAGNLEVLAWARREAALRTEQAGTGPAQARTAKRVEMAPVEVASVEVARAEPAAVQQLDGATAADGGWFSKTMLLALTRYQQSAALGRPVGGDGKIGVSPTSGRPPIPGRGPWPGRAPGMND